MLMHVMKVSRFLRFKFWHLSLFFVFCFIYSKHFHSSIVIVYDDFLDHNAVYDSCNYKVLTRYVWQLSQLYRPSKRSDCFWRCHEGSLQLHTEPVRLGTALSGLVHFVQL